MTVLAYLPAAGETGDHVLPHCCDRYRRRGTPGGRGLHLDLRADGVTTAGELERLLALGARRVDVGQDPDVSWVVLSDPEGNEFCLLSRSVQVAQRAPDGAAS